MARMIKLLALVAVQSVAVAIPHATAAEQPSFTDFPILVQCELGGIQRAFYLSKIDADGVAVYISPDRQAGTVTIHGTAQPMEGEWSGSCKGKSLQELRQSGQAFDLR